MRHRWLNREVIGSFLGTAVLGAALFWLLAQLRQLPEAGSSMLVYWTARAAVLLFFVLVVLTIRHILTNYDIERTDPGNPRSLKRLMRRLRFRLPIREVPGVEIPLKDSLRLFENGLIRSGYKIESDSHTLGRVYTRDHRAWYFVHWRTDRVIVLRQEPLSIFVVDQILQQTIRHIRSRGNRPSRRNLLLLVSSFDDAMEMASAAAGIVNFLGKLPGATLSALLLAPRQNRLFFPLDRSLHPRTHRLYQHMLHVRLLLAIFAARRGMKPKRQDHSDPEAQVRAPQIHDFEAKEGNRE